MLVIDHRDKIVENPRALFPEEIIKSRWILYHGTTNYSEDRIETEGFRWRDYDYTKDDVKNLISIYKTMDWVGITPDGFGSLHVYAMNQDFNKGSIKPIFFNLLPDEVIQYTKPWRTGGETANLLHRAITELQQFLENEDVRREFRALRYKPMLQQLGHYAPPEELQEVAPEEATDAHCELLAGHLNNLAGRQIVFPNLIHAFPEDRKYSPWKEDLDWLAKSMTVLSKVYDKVNRTIRSYEYGVIYAVQFGSDDVSCMRNLNNGMLNGIAHHKEVPKDRIVAKALISGGQPRLSADADLFLEVRNTNEGISGLFLNP
jgi:hypothetical protein